MRRLLSALVLVALSSLAIPALASGRIIYHLVLDPPKEVMHASGDARTSFAQMAIDRLQKRFKAASVREVEFRAVSPSMLTVETGWDHERPWMEALLTAPGKLEVRRTTPDKPDWLGLARHLPAGVELRGDQPPYVWAAKRSTLRSFLGHISLPDTHLTVFPEDGGFRSVSLGEVVATERQLKASEARRSSTGAPFVHMEFDPAVGASLAAAHVSDVEKVAIVLDGELVGFVPAKAFQERAQVRLSVPPGAVADDRTERDLWIRQVAGRLAAPLPITIAVLKE